MLAILICWSYIFLSSISFGYVLHYILKIKTKNIILISFSGLFVVTILASVWAIFERINIEFHIVLLLLNIFIWKKEYKNLTLLLKRFLFDLKQITSIFKWFFIIISFLILAQSANVPVLPDNASYYIQTIKWLNEYGFVTGLANLHLFLGQTSGWHITQSVYNFSFLYDNFHHLNGYILLLGNFWAFQRLHSYFANKNLIDLAFGLLPLSYLLLFQFVSSPSPDLPIYIFSLLLIYLFLNTDKENISNNFPLMIVIALFLIYIKITAFLLFTFPIIVLFQNYNLLKQHLSKVIILSGLIFILFVAKNYIITGYPLFPLIAFDVFELQHQVPKNVMDFFFGQKMMHSFYIPFVVTEISFFEQLRLYFFHNGIDGYIALTTIILLVILPIFIQKQSNKNQLWFIYTIFITNLILLWLTSPQIRFYIHFMLFFGLFILAFWIQKKSIINLLSSFNILILATFLFIPIQINHLTNNLIVQKIEVLNLNSFLLPKQETEISFEKITVGNLNYNSPVDTKLFWITGNGNLPCVSKDQINYFQNNFHIIPQLRTKNLKDGFYSKNLTSNDSIRTKRIP